MLRRLRSHLSYANVAATLALVLAVGGSSAYAVSKIRTRHLGYHAVTASKLNYNAVTAGKVRNGSLSHADVRNGSLRTEEIRNGSLRAEDFAAGQAPKGEKGDKGDPATSIIGTVSAAGALVNGRGVTAISPGVAGVYAVTFNQDVSKCATVATIGDSDAGMVTAASSGPQVVTFRTYDEGGGPEPRPFSFVVAC